MFEELSEADIASLMQLLAKTKNSVRSTAPEEPPRKAASPRSASVPPCHLGAGCCRGSRPITRAARDVLFSCDYNYLIPRIFFRPRWGMARAKCALRGIIEV